jgi:hypothetical protein
MGFGSREIQDDRGTERGLYGAGLSVRGATTEDVLPREVYRRVRSRLGLVRLDVVVDWVFLLVLGEVGTFILLGSGHRPETVVIALWGLVPFAVCVPAHLWLARRGFYYFRTDRIVRSMLTEKRCPACGYDIASARVEEDGCTVCPECGGAWKTPEVADPEPGHELADREKKDDGGPDGAQGGEAGRGEG